jgi:hypothetical protein
MASSVRIALFIFLVGCPLLSHAGALPDSVRSRTRDTVTTVETDIGTARVSGTVTSDTTHPSILRKKKSPGLAMLYSALLPGAGQFYNESYWKVPVVLGFSLYFTSEWLNYNRRYHDNRDQFAASLAIDGIGDSRLLSARDFYKSERDTFTWYLFLTYLITIADAYVDASLYDFNVGGDLSLRVLPGTSAVQPTPIGFTLHLGF